MGRRPSDQVSDLGVDALITALEATDIVVTAVQAGGSFDVVLTVMVDDRPLTLPVEVKAYCTGAVARELITRHKRIRGAFPVVVSDKITAEARELLNNAGWSWLDRRGRLHLRGPAIRVDSDVGAATPSATPGPIGRAITGRGGIGVAYWLCTHPGRSLSPTHDAPGLHVAPSTISTGVRRLAQAGLVDDDGTGIFPELFFELADVWRSERTWLAAEPERKEQSTADMSAVSWCRTGTAAAAAYGAPVVTASGGPVELYVAGPVEITIAARRYGSAEPGTGAAVLAVAPTSAVVERPTACDVVDVDGWPAAPVLAVALDLAQDRARGREILTDWEHPDAVWR
jgi:hypothetical protein